MKLNFAEEVQPVTLLAPVDIVATATVTKWLNLSKVGAGQVEIEFPFGVFTSTDSTGEVVITIEADDVNDTSSSDTTAAAIAFNYRLSSAVGADSLGAITAATSSGVAIPQDGDNKTLYVYVDPAAAAKKYIRGVITPTAESTVTLVAAAARFIPRKAQNSLSSSS